MQPISGPSQFSLRGSVHPLTARYPDAGPADASQPLTGMTLYFAPSAEQQAALQAFLAEQQTPGSPSYHQWLSPAQYAAAFGLSPSDVAAVTAWLQRQGFAIVSSTPLSVKFSGTVGQVEAAFQTRIDDFNVNGKMRRANTTPLSLPAALQGVVAALRGTSEFRPRPRLRSVALPHFTAGNQHFVAPADFATLYDVNPLYNEGNNGSGQTIVVVGQSAIVAADVANFRSAASLPANAPTMTLVPGSGTATQSTLDEEESDLDVEWSGAVARNATINFVYVGNSKNYSVFDSLQYAIQNKLAPIISISYGACEAAWSSADITTVENLLQQANAQGQTVIAAAGDNAAADCDVPPANSTQVITQASLGLAVDYPGSSPYVTAIGGTEFSADVAAPSSYWNSSNSAGDGSAIQYIPAEVWDDTSTQNGLEGGGGGMSALFGKPSWQTGAGVPADGARDVPDISLNASPQHDGYVFCSSAASASSCSNGFADSSSNLVVAGGTSFGAPTFAGILALINQKEGSSGQGNFNPAIYAAAATSYATAFHDVTTGNNDVPCKAGTKDCGSSGEFGYAAAPNYDLASGWGAIDAANFASVVAAASTTTPAETPTTVALSANTITPTVGTSDTFTAVVTANSGSSTLTGTVQFAVNGTDAGTPVTLTAGSAGAASATFSYTFSAAGSYTITATYSGSSSFSGSTGTLDVTAAVPSSSGQSFGLSATNVTVAAGASGTSTITVQPSGGFTGSVALTVSSPSTLTNVCFPAMPAVTVSGTSAVTAALTVDTTQRACQTPGSHRAISERGERSRTVLRASVILLSLLCLGAPALRRRRGLWMILLLAGIGSAGLMGCGGSSGSGTTTTSSNTTAPPGSYTITVTGTNTAAQLSASTSFTLTIQ